MSDTLDSALPDSALASGDATVLTATSLDSSTAANQERELSAIQYFDDISDKTLPILGQIATAAAVAVAAMFGTGAALVAGTAMLAFELGRAHFKNRADLNRELDLYHKDIARVLGKSPGDKLTIADMRKAADENQVGDKAIKPLKMELEHLAYRGKYTMLSGAARTLATTLSAIIMSSALPDSIKHLSWSDMKSWSTIGNLAMPMSGALMMVGGATMAIDNWGKSYFDRHKPLSVYTELMDLQKASRQQNIAPEQVFNIVIKLDKELAKAIETQEGKPYTELTHRNKERIIQEYENRAHAAALAEHINNGDMKVTAVALSACGQVDWPQQVRREIPQETALTPAQDISSPLLETKSFLATLTQKRIIHERIPRQR